MTTLSSLSSSSSSLSSFSSSSSSFFSSPSPSISSSFSLSSSFSPSSSSPLSPSPNETLICQLSGGPLRVPLAVLYSLIFLVGLAGNLLALWVFLFLHGKRNSIRVFLINVAVADLVLLACLPFRVLYHALGDRWLLGKLACRFLGNLFYMNMYVSITLLGFISIDRYTRLSGRRVTSRTGERRSWVACGVLWGMSLAGLVPMVMAAEGGEDKEEQCFQYRQRRGAMGKAYLNLVLVSLFWLVFLLLTVSYGKIACHLLGASHSKPDKPNAHHAARKSFFVLFLFTLCFGPYHAFRPVYVLSQLSQQSLSCDYMRLMDWTNEVMLLFSALNSVLDPVMYFLLSGSVRRAVARALGDRFHFLKDSSMADSTLSLMPRPSIILSPSRIQLQGLADGPGQVKPTSISMCMRTEEDSMEKVSMDQQHNDQGGNVQKSELSI